MSETPKKPLTLSSISLAIISDPISNTKSLSKILKSLRNTRDEPLKQKQILFSALAIFNDILPSYTIVNRVEKNIKLSEKVSVRRNYENKLLKHYSNFVSFLSVAAKEGVPDFSDPISKAAIFAVLKLLENNCDFNNAEKIADIAIKCGIGRSKDFNSNIRAKAARILKSIIGKNINLSLYIAKTIGKLVEKTNFSIPIEKFEVLVCFNGVHFDKNCTENRKNAKCSKWGREMDEKIYSMCIEYLKNYICKRPKLSEPVIKALIKKYIIFNINKDTYI